MDIAVLTRIRMAALDTNDLHWGTPRQNYRPINVDERAIKFAFTKA